LINTLKVCCKSPINLFTEFIDRCIEKLLSAEQLTEKF